MIKFTLFCLFLITCTYSTTTQHNKKIIIKDTIKVVNIDTVKIVKKQNSFFWCIIHPFHHNPNVKPISESKIVKNIKKTDTFIIVITATGIIIFTVLLILI